MATDHAEMLEVLLANSTTWQSTFTGTASMSDARKFIHLYECEEDAPYPRAIVEEDTQQYTSLATGQAGGTGSLYLNFLLAVDASTYPDREQRRAWVRSKLMDVRSEMEVLSLGRGTPSGYDVTYMVVRSIRIEVPPMQVQASDIPIGNIEDVPVRVEWYSRWLVEW